LKVYDYIVDGFKKLISLTIISPNNELVKDIIVNEYSNPISIYRDERGNLPGNFKEHYDCDIIVTVVTCLEVHNIKKTIANADPQAFMQVKYIKKVKGGMVSRSAEHKYYLRLLKK